MRNLAVAKCRSSVSASGIARSAMTAKLTASVNEKSWSAYRSSQSTTARASSARVLRTTTSGTRSTCRTNARAVSRAVRRMSRACVSATTKFVVTIAVPRWICCWSAADSARWSGSRRTASAYHALVSTNSSPATARRSPGPWTLPTGLLTVGEIPVVLPRHVVSGRAPPLAVGQAYNPQGGVLAGIEHLALQRLESLTQYAGLRDAELTRQATEPGPGFGVEVHLDGFSDAARAHDIIS